MRDIISGLLGRIQDILLLVGDFFTYLFELIMKDSKFRLRFLIGLAVAAALIVGSVVFLRSRDSSARKSGLDIYPTQEVTSRPVVEEVVSPTPQPAKPADDTSASGLVQTPADGEAQALSSDIQSQTAQEDSSLQADSAQDQAGSSRSVSSDAVSSSGSLTQINEYVAKKGSSPAGSGTVSSESSESSESSGSSESSETDVSAGESDQETDSDEEQTDMGEDEENYDYDEDYSSYEEDGYYEEEEE